MINIHAENLVDIWMCNSVGGKEDFDVMITRFLETLDKDVSVIKVLNDVKARALEEALRYPQDKALQLSYKAFKISLECQLQRWRN